MKLNYQGAFLFPRGTFGEHPRARWGYGAAALDWNPYNKTLIGSSHPYIGWVGECAPPFYVADLEETAGLPSAQQTRDFEDPAAPYRQTMKALNLKRIGGITLHDGWLHWNYHDNYAVSSERTDVPTHGRTRWPIGEELVSEGLYKIGEFHQKWTAEYMCTSPGGLIATGRGWGAGSAGNSHGPAIFVYPDNSPSEATKVLSHFVRDDQEFPAWTPTDKWTGMAWADEAIMFVGSKGSLEYWYGKPERPDQKPDWFPGAMWPDQWKFQDRCRTGKGYHSTEYDPVVAFYDPNTFKLKHIQDLEENFFSRCGSTGGMAYDPETKRVFIVENNQENPICHVYTLEVDDIIVPEPEPKPEPDTLPVEITIGDIKYKGHVFKDER